MKKIILLGAGGRTAREIIPRLFAQEDVELTLFMRDTGRLRDLGHGRVRVINENLGISQPDTEGDRPAAYR